MKVLKLLLGIIVVVAIIGIFAGGEKKAGTTASTEPGLPAPAKPEEPPVKVSAGELLKAYKENEVAANQKYKGKRLEVSARVDSIESGIGDRPYLVLVAGGQYEFSKPQAHLAESQEGAAASLKKGQQVSLLCVGNSEVAGTPMLKECTLQS